MRFAWTLLVLLAPAVQAEGDDVARHVADLADAEKRTAAAQALREMRPGRADVVEAVAALLEHEDPATRGASVDLLETLLVGHGYGLLGRAERRRKSRRLTTKDSEAAVERALEWLTRFQDTKARGGDGRWDCDGFAKHAADVDGAGMARYDIGVTALALLALLGTGDPLEGPHAANIREGLEFLIAEQADDGCFGPRGYARLSTCQAMAVTALGEAWILTGDVRYRRAVAKGLTCMRALPFEDRWRYTPRDPPDAHTAGCAFVALGVAGLGGVPCDGHLRDLTREDILRLTNPYSGEVFYEPGRIDSVAAAYGYERGSDGRMYPTAGRRGGLLLDRKRYSTWYQGLTALCLWGRMLHSRSCRRDRPVREAIGEAAAWLPKWGEGAESVDMCGWMYGAGLLAACHKSPRTETVKWFKALHALILPRQHTTGARAGSWDPVGVWGHAGGRIYATAALARALEAPYLYDFEAIGLKNAPKAFTTAYKALQKTAKKDASEQVRARASEIVERLEERWRY